MTRKTFFAVVVLAQLTVVSSQAEPTSASRSKSSTSPAQATSGISVATTSQNNTKSSSVAASSFDPTFPLVPGDSLAVIVANHPEFSVQQIPIAPNGRITLPYIGSLAVAGKRIGELQSLVTKALSSQLRHPSVAVTIVQASPREVNVLGAVRTPGTVPLRQGWRISEVVAAAGGLTAEPEDVKATLKRRNATAISVDLQAISQQPDIAANQLLKTGDVLNVVALPVLRVTMNGDVGSPGVLKLPRSAHVLDAIVGSGGLAFRPQETKASLVRAGKVMPLDVRSLFDEQVSKANIPLKDGDLLTFEGIQTNISVVSNENLVGKPGLYQLRGNATALQAILLAGGLTVPVEQTVITIRRGTDSIPVDYAAAIGNPKSDVSLENGDVLNIAPPAGPRVRISGAVGTPGLYTFREGSRLLDAILQVGGLKLTPGAASINVLRTLPNGRQTRLNADASLLFEAKDLGQNLLLQDGDIVLINEAAKATKTIFIGGQVASQGPFEVAEGEGVLEAIMRAGGATPRAALSRVTVKHNGQLQTVDLSHAYSSPEQVTQIALAQGDVINVPENTNQVLVMNAVAKPGYVPVPEGGVLTLGDALLLAGGPSDHAKLKEVAILSPKANNTVERQIVSVDAVAQGNLTINYPLHAGDIVWVPRAKDKKPASCHRRPAR